MVQWDEPLFVEWKGIVLRKLSDGRKEKCAETMSSKLTSSVVNEISSYSDKLRYFISVHIFWHVLLLLDP